MLMEPPHSVIVYYLIDGWERFEVVPHSTGENSVHLDEMGVVGSEVGTVLIFASDGFNHATATVSDLVVRQGLPQLYLDWPAEGRVQNSFNFLSLEASVGEPGGSVCLGYGCEAPDGFEVVWTSDLDGEIARGANVEVFPEDDTGLLPLQVGTHVITVTVTDSFGNEVFESGELTIR